MSVAWLYVIDNGRGHPKIKRKSHAGISIVQNSIGNHTVTFPPSISRLTCVATLNNSVGMITAVPGDNAGRPPNTVNVLTFSTPGGGFSPYDFSLAVFYGKP